MANQQHPLPESLKKSLDSTKVEYVQLGKSGLRVSNPILGAMSFGHPDWAPWVIDEEKALPLLKAAYDRGLNTWDTANVYSNGESEIVIGKAIKKFDIPRHKLVILSKCYRTVGEEHGVRAFFYSKEIQKSKDYVNHGGLSRQAIFLAVEASLARLGTPYLDLLQIHRFDYLVPIEETMEALHDLVKSGKVRYIGASTRPPTEFGNTTRSAAEKNNQAMVSTGLGEVDLKIIKRVEELAEKKGWKMSQVALAWINTKVSSRIIGFSSIGRMDEAIETRGKTPTEEEIKYLEELYQPKNVVGHS